jgi:hypothetical protein
MRPERLPASDMTATLAGHLERVAGRRGDGGTG